MPTEENMAWMIGLIIPVLALSIPLSAIYLYHVRKTQDNRIREMELQKEILQLELEKQNSKIRLLEEENKKLDRVINS